MSLSPAQRRLVHQLGDLHKRAANGDREAIGQCTTLVRKADAGDKQAYALSNTLRVIHWKRTNKVRFAQAEVFYRRLQQHDPQAWQELRSLVSRVKSGDTSVKPLFSTLKAVHRKYKSSAWSGPGQPQTGHYPMPTQHRPGIVFGAMDAPPLFDPNILAGLLALIARARYSIPASDVSFAMPSYAEDSSTMDALASTDEASTNSMFESKYALASAATAAPATRRIFMPKPAPQAYDARKTALTSIMQPKLSTLIKKPSPLR